MLDLSRTSIAIPEEFRELRYNGGHFPGAGATSGVEGGANCQQYAYSLLRHHGYELPDFRSSELWADTDHTAVVQRMEPFDLVLFHDTPESWGAHVGLCVGDDMVLHLSKRIGTPVIETLTEMRQREEYRCLIGIKRVLRRTGN